jgi:hypothetical protein
MIAVAAHQGAQILLGPIVEQQVVIVGRLPIRQQSNASSITSMPRRSQISSNSGAGGLWLVRIALQPISWSSWTWRSSARG